MLANSSFAAACEAPCRTLAHRGERKRFFPRYRTFVYRGCLGRARQLADDGRARRRRGGQPDPRPAELRRSRQPRCCTTGAPWRAHPCGEGVFAGYLGRCLERGGAASRACRLQLLGRAGRAAAAIRPVHPPSAGGPRTSYLVATRLRGRVGDTAIFGHRSSSSESSAASQPIPFSATARAPNLAFLLERPIRLDAGEVRPAQCARLILVRFLGSATPCGARRVRVQSGDEEVPRRDRRRIAPAARGSPLDLRTAGLPRRALSPGAPGDYRRSARTAGST